MKPQFEIHEGQLFRMLDKPVPLTDDTKLPVLVQLIQDDTMLGKANKKICRQKRLSQKIICIKLEVDGLFLNGNYTYRYEIIGTFVEEGSEDWAWHMMQEGYKIKQCESTSQRFYAIREGNNYCAFYDNEWKEVDINTRRNYCEFIEYAKAFPGYGWKIYKEPKPEPIFTTGDKVTDGVIEGTIIHIEDAIADVCPSTDEYKIELRNLNHIPESPKQDDVEKPLRSMIDEAKAIGKNIRTYYQDIVFTPQALEACLNQGKFRWWNICNWELTDREQNYYPSTSTSSDAPNPESATQTPLTVSDATQYKVGDWIQYAYPNNPEFDIEKDVLCNAARIVSVNGYYENNVNIWIPSSKTYSYVSKKFITKVLSPSEVIVHIGCLSGTIGKSCEPACFLMWHSSPRMGFDYSIIKFTALDKETRELVEGLLEAQEEDKRKGDNND